MFDVIISIFIILMVFQWFHPFSASYIYKLNYDIRMIVHLLIGVNGSLAIVFSVFFYLLHTFQFDTLITIIIGFFIIANVINNMLYTKYISHKIDKDNELNIQTGLLITSFGSFFILLLFIINVYLDRNSGIPLSFLHIDGTNPIFYTILMNLIIFIYSFISLYIFLAYVVVMYKISRKTETKIVINYLKSKVNSRVIVVVILIGLFMGYFYLASLYPPGDEYRYVYQNTLTVFQLATATVLIPKLLDAFSSKRINEKR